MEWKSVCGTVSQHATAEAVLGHHRADWMIFWARVAQSWHAQNPERAVSVSRPINFQIVLHGGNYDENGDGELSMDEFRHLSNSLCMPCLLRVRACVRARACTIYIQRTVGCVRCSPLNMFGRECAVPIRQFQYSVSDCAHVRISGLLVSAVAGNLAGIVGAF